MRENPKHIDEPILTGRVKASYTPMYSMHKYWSKKPSEIIAEYIESYTDKGDIILDAFSGSGVTILEAVRLGRRAIGIDLNTVANFITRVTLEPVNLSHLNWAYRDIERFCNDKVSELFETKCQLCGRTGTIDFVVRHGNDPLTIGYSCTCTRKRLFKQPDEHDKRMDEACNQMRVPFWYPENTLLHTTRRDEPKYVHELFTRRNIITLASILHAIENLQDQRVRNVMKLAFSAALDKCSRLKPLSKHSDEHYDLREGWVAARFYTPPIWQEVNPLKAFQRSFLRVYQGKKDSNGKLLNVTIGSSFKDLESGAANVLIFEGSAEEILRSYLPQHSIDYVLTDPPFGSAIQYLTLSTFWSAWLRFALDYEREIVVDTRRGKTRDQYDMRIKSVFYGLGKVAKIGSYVHVFYNDIKGPYLHIILNSLMEAGISPQRIIHQPPPSSFGTVARAIREHYGSYIVRGKILGTRVSPVMPLFEGELRRKIAEAARQALIIRNGKTTIGSVLHSVYKQLDEHEISIYAQYNAAKLVRESVSEFTQPYKGKLEIIDSESIDTAKRAVLAKLRDAVLDSESFFADEVNINNRVRQLAEKRMNLGGITPDDIQHVRSEISEREKKEHRHGLFTDLLSDFGRELGFQVDNSASSGDLLTWTKANSLRYCFKFDDRKIRLLAPLNQNGSELVSKWGNISYLELALELKKWCQDNPTRGNDIRVALKGLDGPSYTRQRNGGGTANDYRHLKLRVATNTKVCPDHYLIRLSIPGGKLDITPGQFFHIVCDPDEGETQGYPLTLRRPFSIHGTQYTGFKRGLLARTGEIPIEIRNILERRMSSIDILYKVVGVGTKSLSEKVGRGSIVDVIGPCGKGFSIGSQRTAIIVAGGIGIAPLVALAERLRYWDRQVYVYFGALKKELLRLATSRPDSTIDLGYTNGTREFVDVVRTDFEEIGIHEHEVRVCTDDGLMGEKGRVTELLDKDLKSGRLPHTDVCIYACGPYNMLRSTSEIAKQYSLECQVLLEERMACGIGACLSCSCEVTGPGGTVERKRVCRDGPVFDSGQIRWKD